jgi:hypothetical protein
MAEESDARDDERDDVTMFWKFSEKRTILHFFLDEVRIACIIQTKHNL